MSIFSKYDNDLVVFKDLIKTDQRDYLNNVGNPIIEI